VFTGDWALAWQGIKDIAAGIFGAIAAIVEGVLNHIGLVWSGFAQVLRVLFAPVIDWLGRVFETIKEKVSEAIETVIETFGRLAAWFTENVWTPLKDGFTEALERVREIFQTVFDTIRSVVTGAWQGIMAVWGAIATWFRENVFAPITNSFGSMFTDIRQGFETVFNGMKNFVRGVMNNIIDFLNGVIEGVVSAINTIIGAINAVGELAGLPEIGYIDPPHIPHLATGGVIPPNAEFLAVLGDQRSGRNIEAPEALIRQIIREEVGNLAGETVIPITLTLDGETVYRNQQRVSRQHGKSLLTSGVTR
jgi:hypothetical protein